MLKPGEDPKVMLQRFMELRDRDDKPTLSQEEYIEGLLKIRDGALYWMQQCVIMNTSKGTGGARLALEYANAELLRIGENESKSGTVNVHLFEEEIPDFIDEPSDAPTVEELSS